MYTRSTLNTYQMYTSCDYTASIVLPHPRLACLVAVKQSVHVCIHNDIDSLLSWITLQY